MSDLKYVTGFQTQGTGLIHLGRFVKRVNGTPVYEPACRKMSPRNPCFLIPNGATITCVRCLKKEQILNRNVTIVSSETEQD